jgi:hypothetical protein
VLEERQGIYGSVSGAWGQQPVVSRVGPWQRRVECSPGRGVERRFERSGKCHKRGCCASCEHGGGAVVVLRIWVEAKERRGQQISIHQSKIEVGGGGVGTEICFQSPYSQVLIDRDRGANRTLGLKKKGHASYNMAHWAGSCGIRDRQERRRIAQIEHAIAT